MLRFKVHRMLRSEEGERPLRASGTLPQGGLGIIDGPSGAGKSTLLKILAGTMSGNPCRIEQDETVWADTPRRIDRPSHKRLVSLLFQDVALFPNMSVKGNIRFAWPKGRDENEMEEWIDRAGLSELKEHHPDKLSGGQQQRVGILRAMAAHPELLLLDEPFSAMDAVNRDRMLELLEEYRLRKGISVLIATHAPLNGKLKPDREWELRKGKLRKKPLQGPKAQKEPPTGVLLAGGKSRRMGKEKGLLQLDGRAMAQHVLELLRAHTQDPMIIANDLRYRRFGHPLVCDQWKEEGPLAGILTALMATRAERILILPCDMPFIEETHLKALLDQEREGIIVASYRGERHPLVGIYPQAFFEEAQALFDQGVRSVLEVLERMEQIPVHWVELSPYSSRSNGSPFRNLNRPEELPAGNEPKEEPIKDLER